MGHREIETIFSPSVRICAYVSIRQHTSAYVSIRQHTSAYVSIRQHTSAYVSIRQHTSAYVVSQAGGRCSFYSRQGELGEHQITTKRLRLFNPKPLPTAWSEDCRMSDSSCARQRTRSSTFMVSESLFPVRSHSKCKMYPLKVPLRVLVESASTSETSRY